jgi:hypothetical protein
VAADIRSSSFELSHWVQTYNTTVDQLIKESVPEEDPEKHYRNRFVDSREERFYGSQPLCLADGAPFKLEDICVKICDFGHGISILDLG